MNILRDNISTIQHAGSHVLSVTGIALHHLVVGLEARHRDFLHRVGLVGCLGCRNDWGVGDEGEMDTRIWDQVGLELIEINVEGTIETERCGDGGDDCSPVSFSYTQSCGIPTLSNQTVKILVVRTLQTKISPADIVDSLVINHE